MTDEEMIREALAAKREIDATPNKWGRIEILVSGGEVKYVNVTRPPLREERDCGKMS